MPAAGKTVSGARAHIRRRRRFWNGDQTALATLWTGLVQALRVIAPVTPFLAEHLWQILVVGLLGVSGSR